MRYVKYIALLVMIILFQSCTKIEAPVSQKVVYAIAYSDPLMLVDNFNIVVKLTKEPENTPITGADVSVNHLYNLYEREPGVYRISWAECYPPFDTINYVIVVDGETLTYSSPLPSYRVFITRPDSSDRINGGEDLPVSWLRVNGASYYEVVLLRYEEPPGSLSTVFDTLLTDTTVTIPGRFIQPDNNWLIVNAYFGPRLQGNKLRPNFVYRDWVGFFIRKVYSLIILNIQ